MRCFMTIGFQLSLSYSDRSESNISTYRDVIQHVPVSECNTDFELQHNVVFTTQI